MVLAIVTCAKRRFLERRGYPPAAQLGGDAHAIEAAVRALLLATVHHELVIYTKHTSTDQVAGPGGGAKRTIGHTVVAGS